jgi:hypothetical protein
LYRQLYSEPTKNPFGTNEEELEVCTRAVFEVFRATGLALEEGELLLNIQANFCRPIGGIVIFVPDGASPTGMLRVLRGVHLCPGVPGRSRDRMKYFAFEGDLEGVDTDTIALNKAQLTITADVLVPGSISRTNQLLDAEPTIDILGPYKASVAITRTMKCCIGAYIPFDLMEMVLGADLTARQAYEFITPAMVDTGYEAIWEPLVDFLTVALVKPSAENTTPLTLQPCVGITGYVPSPAVVSRRRQHFLYHDLSALIPASATASSSDQALVDVARGMRDMVKEARLDRNDRLDARGVARLPRTMRDRLGDSPTDCLLLMCRVNNDNDLPQVGHEWAARPRGVSERHTLQQSVDDAALPRPSSMYHVLR